MQEHVKCTEVKQWRLSQHAAGNTSLPVSSIQIHRSWTQDDICHGKQNV